MTARRIGIGMTSQRTRQRLVDRLREAGIKDERVLAQIYQMPRHIFVDEALAVGRTKIPRCPLDLAKPSPARTLWRA